MKDISNLYSQKALVLFLFCGFCFQSIAQNTSKFKSDLSEYEKKQSSALSNFIKQGYPQFIETKNGDYSELVGQNAVGKPMYLLTGNNNIVTGIKANVLHSGFDGFLLEGLGSRIALWENGQPRGAHELFRTAVPTSLATSRVKYVSGQNPTLFRHATHIAGTLIGNQFSPSASSPINQLVKGVAYKGEIKAWDWLNVPSEMQTAAAVDNIKIGNTSFGINPLYMHPVEFGRYNEIAMQWDAVMCANTEFQIVKSVGNARDDLDTNGFPQYSQVSVLNGYDLLEGAGISKNVLVVGSVNLATISQPVGPSSATATSVVSSTQIGEPYSSWGPTDDGRIKPDLVSHGKNVFSSLETQNNTYGYYSGTSQAAAGVTGGIVLLQEYWKKTTTIPNPNPMWSSTARALLIHNVDEIDEKGPDYRNGWGYVNIAKAATTIKNRSKNVIIREDILTNGQVIKLNIAASGQEDLKVTIAWTDPAGNVVPIDVNNPNPSLNEIASKLVNDIDIRLIRKDANGNDDLTLLDPTILAPNNNVLFPWIMRQQIAGNSEAVLARKAERGDNNRDNVEKIEVYQNLIPATGGMFQLQISHKGTLVETCSVGQKFSLIVSGVSFCNNDLVFLQNQDNELTDGVRSLVLANTIKSSNIIKVISPFLVNNSDFVEYQAQDFIELLPQSQNGGSGNEGFTSEFGSDFLAHLPCTGINARTAFSSTDIEHFLNDTTVNDKIKVEKGEVVVFPNPYISDLLNIQFSILTDSKFTVEIYDITGKLFYNDNDPIVYEAGVHKKTLDANFLPSGTYLIKTTSNEGTSVVKLLKN